MIREEIERTRQEAGGMVAMLFLAAVIFGGLALSGCAGGKVFVGFERTDEIQETRRTIDKPLSCLFSDCRGSK